MPLPIFIHALKPKLKTGLLVFWPNLRLTHSHTLGSGFFELRLKGKEGIGRAFYCFLINQRIVILHAFVKKTRSTPEQELKTARKRMKGVKNG
jgi:phage-related protein